MDSYDTLFERAKDEPAFSNGTEGYGWIDANCSNCVNDKPAREGDEGNGCPLILVALMQRTPAKWLPCDPGNWSIEGQYTCVMYRHEDDGGGPEPKPIPDPPGQLTLFPREGFEGVRMLRPAPSESPLAVA